MNEQKSLQIQAVLYKNEPAALKRAMMSLCNAVLQDRKREKYLGDVTLVWGDASPAPIFDEALLEDFRRSVPDGALTLKYDYFNENTGYGKGHNRMAMHSEAELLMVMNPDILVAGSFFEVMVPPLFDETTGLTEARQTPIEHPKDYDMATGETNWSSGACFLIRTALYQKHEGFDDVDFFMYYEDVDFSLRLRREGLRLLYQPDAPVFHAKRLDKKGKLEHTGTEVMCSPEAQIICAYKWRRDDLVKQLCLVFSEGDEVLRRALSSFLQKRKTGLLKRLDGDTSLYTPEKWENRFGL